MDPTIRVAESSDIPGIVEMQALVWQDHFLRERNVKVPMMRRSAANMEYYLAKDPGGSFVMLDKGKVVASIVSHAWGSVGWFGPLEVNPLCQGRGYGKALVQRSLEYLRSRGCTNIGCETMAGSARNIAFYRKQGFETHGISNVLYKRLDERPPVSEQCVRDYQASRDESACRTLWAGVLPGLDYSMEMGMATSSRLGRSLVLDTDDGPAHAIVHTYEMFEESQNAIIKLLVAPQGDEGAASTLLEACESSAITEGKTGMFIRTYDPTPPDLNWFFARGYVLQGLSARLILEGVDETGQILHVSCWSG